ncbi:protein NipSnap homolog 3A isoform X3 [Phascolarctos cinereus]|uniref:Protein NipSnap homolog 3A isoform X2 n=1 Tax=Phascolarctos cinereus TaxID=38626 RepID=A0A6P5L376_PHACI|nr:protein NipSnap homolog 3A isoform X2 [Phascolarctos cinereus]
MFHLRRHWGTLVASASRRPPWVEVCASFATDPRQYDGTFYEFRTYIIQPAKMNEFLENINKHIHLRTAHSELVGCWRQEFGGVMNKVFHIWKYGVYELATFQMKPGGPALWGEHFQKAVNTHIQVGYSKLIGVFHTEYGTLNRVHVLWWTETADSRAAGRHRSHEDARVVAAVRESCNHLKFHENMLLIPTPFSPLK